LNAPLYVYVSRWFDRRRGSALALISSGAYLAGAVWPPVFERVIAVYGWQQAMRGFGVIEMAIIVPLAAVFLRPAPDQSHASSGAFLDPEPGPVLGWPPNLVFFMLCAAAFLCCADGAAADPPRRLLLGPRHFAEPRRRHAFGGARQRIRRQLWGWFSDRTGGFLTLSVCSATQATALTAFLMTQDEIGLFTAFFGLGFSGPVPAYVLTLREFFPARDAQWRVPTLLLFSGCGMAAGACMGGALYDLFGYYGPAFLYAIAANVLNLIIVITLLLRQRLHPRPSLKIA
jgi:MFS family permease